MFTIASIKKIMKDHKMIAIHFDNDVVTYFVDKTDEVIDDDNFSVIDGNEFIRVRGYVSSKGDKKHIGISQNNIPAWIYRPVDTIQGILVLENNGDYDRIDKSRLYML